MKIEMMEVLSNKITNVKFLKEFIKRTDDMSKKARTKIFETLKKLDYNEYACKIAVNPDVLNTRTTEEQIQLMKALKACDYNEYACNIAVDPNVLKARTIEEQIQLMNALKACDYNEYAYKVAVDPDVLNTRTTEDQIQLMKVLKACDYNEYAYKRVVIDPSVLKKRTTEEQIQSMEELYIELKKGKSVVIHSENVEGISDITEFKMYLKELKQKLGKDADVKSDTVVLKFTPDTKKKRKEN